MNCSLRPGPVLVSFGILLSLMIASQAAAQDTAPESQESSRAVPDGYERNDRGRLYQTTYDLQRRFHVGVYDMLGFDEPNDPGDPTHSLVVDMGGVYDYYNSADNSRRRHRFLKAQLMLAPFELDALLYSYDFGRKSDKAPLFVTTFLGTPRRFDLPFGIGAGYSLARLHYRQLDTGDLMLLDLGETHINWELYQGKRLENHILIHTGIGAGVQSMRGQQNPSGYWSSQVGLQASWVLGRRGLTQLDIAANMKWGLELQTMSRWRMGTANMTLERVLFALNDQPLSLFVEPQIRYSDLAFDDADGTDYRVMAGGRLNLFVPTRPIVESSP